MILLIIIMCRSLPILIYSCEALYNLYALTHDEAAL